MLALHAHPDDETLLTGGTLARAAATGHRVVLVTATSGEAGLTRTGPVGLGQTRRAELHEAAGRLGAARVVLLDYADSGMQATDAPANAFCRQQLAAVADRVAALVREEQADLLTGYDAAGGYGHPDHLMVHRVARQVQRDTGIRLLEATVDREALARLMRWIAWAPGLPEGFTADAVVGAWTSRDGLTHHLDVRDQLEVKRWALAAHVSQQTGTARSRTAQLLLRLPTRVASRVLGTEWFHEPGLLPGRRTDIWSGA